MNKYKELLEKHVQWVALAIGGLWLLYMVYAHVLVADSSSVEVGGQPQSASQIDKFVHDTKAIPLREKIERPDKLPDKVGGYEKMIVEQLAVPIPEAFKDTYVRVPIGTGTLEITRTTPQGEHKLVQMLPKAPAPIGTDLSFGRSVVTITPPAPAGGQQPVGVPTMVPWVTVAATIPMKALGTEFNASLPPELAMLHQTTLLRVELQREELLPNGQWGNKVTIQSMNFAANATPLPAWPAQNAPVADKLQFAAMVAGQQKIVAQPDFYSPIVRGDQWRLPGQPVAAPGDAGGPPAVVQPPPAPTPTPTPVTPPRIPGSVHPPLMPPGGTGRPPGSGPPRSGQRGDATPRQLPAGTVAYGQIFNEPPPPTMTAPGGGGLMGQPAVPAAPSANQPGQVPAAKFDPANANDIQIWVHDTHIEPGKTYQYRIRYVILNPVYGAPNACNPQTLGNEFTITSGWSDPPKPVTIPNTTVFFAVAAPKLGNSVKYVTFDVFSWDVNGLTKKSVNADAGDAVDEKLKISVVDIRDGGSTIILMDENGTLSTRNVFVDKDSKEYKDLLKEVAQPTAPLAGG